jgi:hypothetical protein
MKSKWSLVGLMALALAGAPVLADVWDQGDLEEDDGSGTDNELVHGSIQTHDLAAEAGVADQDWFITDSRAYSSYEVLVDGITGDLYSGINADRVTSAGGVLTADAAIPGGLVSRSLRWQNTTAATINDFVRVSGSVCGITCTTADQYTIRFRETTGTFPRFNNSGTQVTVLLISNPTTYTITGTIHYWNNAAVLLATQSINLAAKDIDTYTAPAAAQGQSGFITITNTGRYGDLVGKAVALEPATGFSFDSPLVYKIY